MKVSILYFASARDIASRQRETMTVPEGATVKTLTSLIVREHPPLAKLKGSMRYSVNLVVASDDAVLHDGDEVGVLPPVAGG